MAKPKKKIVRPQYVAKSERKKKSKPPMRRELKMGLWYCAGALVLAAVLFFALYDTGALPVRNGKVVAESDSWIIANLGTNTKQYFRLGDLNGLEGYTRDLTQTLRADANETDFWFLPDDPDNLVKYVYVAANKEPAAEGAETAHDYYVQYFGGERITEIRTEMMDQRAVWYYFSEMDNTTEEGETETVRQLFCFTPAIRGASFRVAVTVRMAEESLTDEEILDLARVVMGRIADAPLT